MTRLIQEERKQGFQSSRKKTTRTRKKRTNRKTRKEETGSKVSTQEIDKLVQFMDELGDGDGQISPSELEAAVRVFRKASVGSSRESRGRELVVRLLEMLREIQLSVKDWFMLIDRSKDGKVQMNELKKGMADLSARLGKRSSLHFSDRDINDLLSFMDPDADGTVTGEEVIMAIKKLNMPMEDQETLARLGKTFEKLHSFMLAQRMRIVDLFSFLDQDGSKSISPEELKHGLLKIMNPTKSSQQGLASSTSRHIRTAEAKLSRHDARTKTRPHTSSSSHLERTRRIIREIKTPATSVRKGRETLLFQPLPSPASRKSTTLFQSTDISRDHIKTIDARIKECHSILKNM
jgi:Ca2+-binding EF-hand superfamily protein